MSAAAARVNVEIGAAFAGNFRSVFGKANSEMGKIGSSIQKLEGRQKELNATIREQERMGRSGSPLKALFAQQEIDQITQKLAKLRGEQERILRQRGALNALGAAGTNVGAAFSQVSGQIKSLTAQTLAAGAGLGFAFQRMFLAPALEFERFQTILETTEGSAEKAAQSLDWVTKFARKTPYNLAQVTEAFVKLRAYGLDPTSGLFEDLGNMASAMGKPVMQAIEAIADAVTGENERLKEFSIRASKAGGKTTYAYTDKAGKQQSKTVDSNDRAGIEKALREIMQERFSGAMEKQSKTLAGLLSNLGDSWTEFTTKVMKAGVFDRIKTSVGGLLDTVERMEKDGSLQRLAKDVGDTMVKAATGAWQFGKALADITTKVADFVGGWKNLAAILVAAKLAPLAIGLAKLTFMFALLTKAAFAFAVTAAPTVIGALAAVGTAFGTAALTAMTAIKGVTIALMANPIGLIMAGIATAVVAAGYVIYKNWDAIKSALGGIFDWIADKAQMVFRVVDMVKGAVGKVAAAVGLGSDQPQQSSAPGAQATAAGVPSVAAAVAAGSGPRRIEHNVNASINNPVFHINGVQDPQAVGEEVNRALARWQRDQEARRRSSMTDNLGY